MFDLEHDLFADHFVGNQILPVVIVGDLAVLVDLAIDLDRGAVIRWQQGGERCKLLLPAFIYLLTGGKRKHMKTSIEIITLTSSKEKENIDGGGALFIAIFGTVLFCP